MVALILAFRRLPRHIFDTAGDARDVRDVREISEQKAAERHTTQPSSVK